MAGVSISRNGKGLQSLADSIAKAKKEVRIGIIGKGKIAEYARYLEYGWVQQVTPKQSMWFKGKHNIGVQTGSALFNPPRPFLRQTFIDCSGKWFKIGANVFRMSKGDLEKSLQMMGMLAVQDIQETIRNNGTATHKFPLRSPLTMAMLQADDEGKGDGTVSNSNRQEALMRTGMLLKNISFEIA